MNSKLSICIPTFNRSKLLIEMLASLVDQARLYDIPIYISDDNSTDDTVLAVEAFARDIYELIFVKVNDSQVGFDRNLLRATSMASSDYIWLVPDDDLALEGSIVRIMPKLECGYSLLVLNAGTYSKNFTHTVEERRLRVFDDEILAQDAHHDLLRIANYITYLGSLVVQRSLWESVAVDSFLGSGFVHICIILNYVIGRSAYIMADPVMKIRLQNASWSNKKFEVWCVSWPRVIWSLPDTYSIEEKARLIPQFPTRSIKMISVAKAAGWIDRRNYQLYYANNDAAGWKKLVLRTIICMTPRALFQVSAVGYFGFKMLSDRKKRFTYRYQLLECFDRV